MARYTGGPGAGGGNGTETWFGMLGPFGGSALDDDFTAGSLDVKWTETDSGGRMTVVMEEPGVQMTHSAGAALELAYISQALPASGDHNITAQVRWASSEPNVNTGGVGLVAFDTAGTDFIALTVAAVTAGPFLDFQKWNSPTSFAATTRRMVQLVTVPMFLRIHVDRTGSNIRVLASQNGRDWITHDEATFAALGLIDIGQVGLHTYNQNTAQTMVARSRGFWTEATSDAFKAHGALDS